MIEFLFNCKTMAPIIKLFKNGIIPILQAAIIVILIVLVIIDLGKAVMAGKEDEIKSAQKLAIKRVVYALVVFLVPWMVNVAITLVADTGTKNKKEQIQTTNAGDDPYEAGQKRASNAWYCWAYPDDTTEQ